MSDQIAVTYGPQHEPIHDAVRELCDRIAVERGVRITEISVRWKTTPAIEVQQIIVHSERDR